MKMSKNVAYSQSTLPPPTSNSDRSSKNSKTRAFSTRRNCVLSNEIRANTYHQQERYTNQTKNASKKEYHQWAISQEGWCVWGLGLDHMGTPANWSTRPRLLDRKWFSRGQGAVHWWICSSPPRLFHGRLRKTWCIISVYRKKVARSVET